MQYYTFPEAKHDLIKPLLKYQDEDLLILWQQNLDRGKYFVAIFCRHSNFIYFSIKKSISSKILVRYIFHLVWHEIFVKLPTLQLDAHNENQPELRYLSHFIKHVTSNTITKYKSIPIESINKKSLARYLPLILYLEKALDSLSPLHRLVLVMSEKFGWTSEDIMNYLQQQGEIIDILDLEAYLYEAYQMLQEALPQDLCSIYLT